MKKVCWLLLAFLLAVWGCEDDINPDTQPAKVFIQTVEIPFIPFLDENGNDWDSPLDPKPDVYFVLTPDSSVNAPDSIHWIDKYGANYSEVTQGDLPLRWPLIEPFEVIDWYQPFYVKVFDKDQIGESDLMGIAGPFTIDEIIDEQPEFTAKVSGELKVEIYWIYGE